MAEIRERKGTGESASKVFSDTQQKKANGSVGRRMKDDSMGSTLGLLSDELNSDLPAVGAEKPSSIVAGDGHTVISSGNEDIKKPGLFDDQDEDDDWFAPPPRQGSRGVGASNPVGGVSMSDQLDPTNLSVKGRLAGLDQAVNRQVDKTYGDGLWSDVKDEVALEPSPADEGGVLFRSHGAMVTQPVPSVPHEESGAGKASRDGAGLHSPFTVSSCQREDKQSSKKRPVGGVSMFGSVAALAELTRRTSSMVAEDVGSGLEEPGEASESPPLTAQQSDSQVGGCRGEVERSSSQHRDPVSKTASFDRPAEVTPLQSSSKDRVRMLSRRQPQSRKARRSAAFTAGVNFEDNSSECHTSGTTDRQLSSETDNSCAISSHPFDDANCLADRHRDEISAPAVPSPSDHCSDDLFGRNLPLSSDDRKNRYPASSNGISGGDDLSAGTAEAAGVLWAKRTAGDVLAADEDHGGECREFGSDVLLTERSESGRETDWVESDGVRAEGLSISSTAADFASSIVKLSPFSSSPPPPMFSDSDEDIFADSSLYTAAVDREGACPGKLSSKDCLFKAGTAGTATNRTDTTGPIWPNERPVDVGGLFADSADIFADSVVVKQTTTRRKTVVGQSLFGDESDDIFAGAVTSPVTANVIRSKNRSMAGNSVQSPITTDIFSDPLNVTAEGEMKR